MDAYDVHCNTHMSVESHLSSPFGLGSGNNTAQGCMISAWVNV